jgi:hypothetical protein
MRTLQLRPEPMQFGLPLRQTLEGRCGVRKHRRAVAVKLEACAQPDAYPGLATHCRAQPSASRQVAANESRSECRWVTACLGDRMSKHRSSLILGFGDALQLPRMR